MAAKNCPPMDIAVIWSGKANVKPHSKYFEMYKYLSMD